MAGKDANGLPPKGTGVIEAARSWLFLAVLLLFVLLYTAALLGGFTSLAGEKWVTRAEPVVFLLLGYCLGQLPARRAEAALREAINRQAQRTEGAQHAKEQAQQARDVLEERAKNARMILGRAANSTAHASRGGAAQTDEALRRSVAAALSILDS